MCPACIASAAAIAAGTGTTGGILAVCIGKITKLFGAKQSIHFRKPKEH